MNFEPLPSLVPDMDLWGATDGRYTYMISHDYEYDEIRASAKLAPSVPFKGELIELGVFDSKRKAKIACEAYSKRMAV